MSQAAGSGRKVGHGRLRGDQTTTVLSTQADVYFLSRLAPLCVTESVTSNSTANLLAHTSAAFKQDSSS